MQGTCKMGILRCVCSKRTLYVDSLRSDEENCLLIYRFFWRLDTGTDIKFVTLTERLPLFRWDFCVCNSVAVAFCGYFEY